MTNAKEAVTAAAEGEEVFRFPESCFDWLTPEQIT
jgi:hypothetical protein